MREIKFRAWHHGAGDPRVVGDMRYCSGNLKLFFENVDNEFLSVEIMQYTGLKDKNGVEIYEGDIIHAFGAPLEVKWIVDGWFADCEQTGICEAGQEWDDNCEVMGNIHENPELLS